MKPEMVFEFTQTDSSDDELVDSQPVSIPDTEPEPDSKQIDDSEQVRTTHLASAESELTFKFPAIGSEDEDEEMTSSQGSTGKPESSQTMETIDEDVVRDNSPLESMKSELTFQFVLNCSSDENDDDEIASFEPSMAAELGFELWPIVLSENEGEDEGEGEEEGEDEIDAACSAPPKKSVRKSLDSRPHSINTLPENDSLNTSDQLRFKKFNLNDYTTKNNINSNPSLYKLGKL